MVVEIVLAALTDWDKINGNTFNTIFENIAFWWGNSAVVWRESAWKYKTKQKKNSHFDYAPNPKNGYHIHVFDIEHRIGWLHLSTYS